MRILIAALLFLVAGWQSVPHAKSSNTKCELLNTHIALADEIGAPGLEKRQITKDRWLVSVNVRKSDLLANSLGFFKSTHVLEDEDFRGYSHLSIIDSITCEEILELPVALDAYLAGANSNGVHVNQTQSDSYVIEYSYAVSTIAGHGNVYVNRATINLGTKKYEMKSFQIAYDDPLVAFSAVSNSYSGETYYALSTRERQSNRLQWRNLYVIFDQNRGLELETPLKLEQYSNVVVGESTNSDGTWNYHVFAPSSNQFRSFSRSGTVDRVGVLYDSGQNPYFVRGSDTFTPSGVVVAKGDEITSDGSLDSFLRENGPISVLPATDTVFPPQAANYREDSDGYLVRSGVVKLDPIAPSLDRLSLAWPTMDCEVEQKCNDLSVEAILQDSTYSTTSLNQYKDDPAPGEQIEKVIDTEKVQTPDDSPNQKQWIIMLAFVASALLALLIRYRK